MNDFKEKLKFIEYDYYDQFQFIGIGEIGKQVFNHPLLQGTEVINRYWVYDKDKMGEKIAAFILESNCIGLCIVMKSGDKLDHLRFMEIAMMKPNMVIMCILITPSKREYTNQPSTFLLGHADMLLVIPSHQKSFNATDKSAQIVKEIGGFVYTKLAFFCVDIIDFCHFIKDTGTTNFGWIHVKIGENLAERIIKKVDTELFKKAQKLLFTFSNSDHFLMRDLEMLANYFQEIVGVNGRLFFQASDYLIKDECILFWIATDFNDSNSISDIEPLPNFSKE